MTRSHIECYTSCDGAIAMRVDAACAALGIGRTTLYALIRQGRLQAVKLSGRTLIPRSELDRIIREQLRTPSDGNSEKCPDRSRGGRA